MRRHTHTEGEGGHAKMEGDIGVILPQDKEQLRLQKFAIVREVFCPTGFIGHMDQPTP